VIVLAVAAGLAVVWYGMPSLLMLFAGILFASLLDACTRGQDQHALERSEHPCRHENPAADGPMGQLYDARKFESRPR
jgi:hypothetical protein